MSDSSEVATAKPSYTKDCTKRFVCTYNKVSERLSEREILGAKYSMW